MFVFNTSMLALSWAGLVGSNLPFCCFFTWTLMDISSLMFFSANEIHTRVVAMSLSFTEMRLTNGTHLILMTHSRNSCPMITEYVSLQKFDEFVKIKRMSNRLGGRS